MAIKGDGRLAHNRIKRQLRSGRVGQQVREHEATRFPYEAKEKALPIALKNVFLQVFLSCFLRKQYNDAIMVIADDMVMETRLQ